MSDRSIDEIKVFDLFIVINFFGIMVFEHSDFLTVYYLKLNLWHPGKSIGAQLQRKFFYIFFSGYSYCFIFPGDLV